ncbi:hypothetical protein FMJ29_20950 [Klebsiella michiganensis]|nr:hypothetical protein [Klebsiella michiganensis]
MKNKVGAQKGAFIKMKQENSYIYQRIYVVCYVPIIAPSFLVKSSGYYSIVLLFLTRMCIFARCGCGKIVAGTVRLFVTQCKGMLTACITLSLPPVLSFGQYCYFDGFWLRMLSVQLTACTDGAKACSYKNIHSNTFSRPVGYLHSLDYPLTFYLVISNKKCIQYPAIDRQL